MDRFVPPALSDHAGTVIYDNGIPGTWLDMIAHSPCLNVLDYAPDGHANRDRFAGPLISFHSSTNSAGGANDHD